MPRQVVQHVRVKPGEGSPLLSEGWKLVRSSRYSDLYARLTDVGNAVNNMAMANGPVGNAAVAVAQDAPGGNMNVNAAGGLAAAVPALDDGVMDELAGLLGAATFEVGAINVQNVEQANAVVQAVAQGVTAEEEALVAAFAGVGLGEKKGGRRSRRNKKSKRTLKNRRKSRR
jgi:hypothetical protein